MEKAFGHVLFFFLFSYFFMLFPQSPRQWNSWTLGLGPHRGKNSPLTFAKLSLHKFVFKKVNMICCLQFVTLQ